MNTRVITVATQLGSYGEQIASLVAEELGFRCLDQEVIERAALSAGVPSKFIRDAEHIRPLRERALAAFANTPGWNAMPWYLGAPPPFNTAYSPERYRKIIDEVLNNLAREGSAVVVGHAGQMALRDRWDTLRVLTVASDGSGFCAFTTRFRFRKRRPRRSCTASMLNEKHTSSRPTASTGSRRSSTTSASTPTI